MEEGDLGHVQGHVLDFSIVGGFREGDLEEGVDSGVPNNPIECLQNVPFHLSEHLVVVERTTHGLQLSNSGHPVFLVTVLSSDEKCSAADELVMALVHNTAGAVPIEKIDSKEQCLR